jgi:hypothetical protein
VCLMFFCCRWWSPHAAPRAAAWLPPDACFALGEGERCIHEGARDERGKMEHLLSAGVRLRLVACV